MRHLIIFGLEVVSACAGWVCVGCLYRIASELTPSNLFTENLTWRPAVQLMEKPTCAQPVVAGCSNPD